jgi:hypothetical protein
MSYLSGKSVGGVMPVNHMHMYVPAAVGNAGTAKGHQQQQPQLQTLQLHG